MPEATAFFYFLFEKCGLARVVGPDLTITSELPVPRANQERPRELLAGRDWIPLFFGKIDHDDIRVLTQAVEHDLFPVAGDVEGLHSGPVLQPGKWARFHGSEIE